MRKKIAKGIMFRRLVGFSYESSIRRALGWFCRLLSTEDFCYAFGQAMKDEAAALPITLSPQHVVNLFDEWNGHKESDSIFTNEDANFADFVFREFNIGNVTPVFLSHSETLANQLCYLNMGTKIRPFPQCIDPQCEWERGDGVDDDSKYLLNAKIEWRRPVWTTQDLVNIGAGQEVLLGVPITMCSWGNTKRVPMALPADHTELAGMSPMMAMQAFRATTRVEALQKVSGGRHQALLNLELPTMEQKGPAQAQNRPARLCLETFRGHHL